MKSGERRAFKTAIVELHWRNAPCSRPHIALRVHDSTADMRYLVVPLRPAGTEGWDAEALAGLVTRDSMIGVSLPKSPLPVGRGRDPAA
jgi:hypothetical protein